MGNRAVFSFMMVILSVSAGYPQTVNPIFDFSVPAKMWFETNCLCSGDFNGDGYDDLATIISLFRNNRDDMTGCALIGKGAPDGLSQQVSTQISGYLPGYIKGVSSCTTGDFNCDGYDDLVLGNCHYGEPQLDRGFIQLHKGSPAGLREKPDEVIRGTTSYGSYGSNLMTTDFDGDGKDDLLVEARFDGLLEGRIYIYRGGKEFQLKSPAFTLSVPGSQSLYVSMTKDVNGDGFTDIVCRSNRNWDNHQHMLYFFLGGPQADEKADRILRTGIFNPSLFFRGNDPGSGWLIGSVNMSDGSQVTRVASLSPASFQLLPFTLPGSVRYMIQKDRNETWFFVVSTGLPVKLGFFEWQGDKPVPGKLPPLLLPGRDVRRINGTVWADTDGDGRKECIVAYTDGEKVKLAEIRYRSENE